MTENNEKPIVRRKKSKFDPEEKKMLLTRLNKIEGHVRSIRDMVQCNTYCPKILHQTKTMDAAMKSFFRELFACHLRDRVTKDLRQGNTETIEELVAVMRNVIK